MITTPSGFYRASFWKLGLNMVRVLPEWLLKVVCLALAEMYFWLRKERREIVAQNLLPACRSQCEAKKKAHRLFRNFALKLAQLWRVESGVPVRNWITKPEEWELIHSRLAEKRGILFVTTHLGNWEHGGLLLAQSGIKVAVVTQPEPGELTEVRNAARAHWGIETIVVGEDSFAFVEVIKKLQEGATVAILVDRPPQHKGVEVELFGKQFVASNAAADLAWASGCAMICVSVIPSAQGHVVKVVSELQYMREDLRTREGRRNLTQQILRVFEPEIREHLEQWYHFVPIWPKASLDREPVCARIMETPLR